MTESVQQWALGVILILLILLPCVFAWRKNNAGAATVTAACGLAAVLVFIPQVQSLTFGPLKAEMRAKIDEADATLTQLRGLASDLARVSVLSVLEQGDIGGPQYETLYAIQIGLERQLTELHVKPQEVQEIMKPLISRIQVAFGIQIEDAALDGLDVTPDKEPFRNCISNARKELSVDKFRACFKDTSISSPHLETLLGELAEFQKTGHIERLDTRK
ncbi:hypothetical protein [Gluconobacter albidus]|uniref:hypothetical protein n=1 Tax=Gluconobacter albidus TaxID=318683 RepID=UPI000AC42E45|nr:hypothetical protein [Gluconobacter albidus]